MYVVAYDITNNKERKLVSKILNNYGERIQKSVWTCNINYNICDKLKVQLQNLNIETGTISIWQAHSNQYIIGSEEKFHKENWSHCI